MCTPEWDIIRLVDAERTRLGARLPDGRLLDLQAAHLALRGSTSPHLRDAVSLRLSGSYGNDLVTELVRAAPPAAVVKA